MITRPDYDTAARIQAAGKAARREHQAWHGTCPKCVAAVVAFEGERWLWVVGGRAGSHDDLVAEFELSLSEAEATLEQYRSRGVDQKDALSARDAFASMLDEIRQNGYPAVAPGWAHRVADLQLPHTALIPCRSCRRDVVLTVDVDLSLAISEQVHPQA